MDTIRNPVSAVKNVIWGSKHSLESWQSIAQERQSHRASTISAVLPTEIQESIPKEGGLPLNVLDTAREQLAKLSKEDVYLTEQTPSKLLELLSTSSISSVQLTTAFLRRAAIAQNLVNCVTELLPERALSRAKYLDDYLKTHGKPVGALHGLPISVKEHIGMKGLDMNAGFVGWVGQTAPDDADVLKPLWEAGCVFFARTPEPQSMLMMETVNNLYGTTYNPFNRNLTCGGSSGGEGALIGIRGSCLGIGTDIGGSVRVPAANNGLYGLRPSGYRMPKGGQASASNGEEHVVPVVGPISTSLEGIKLVMKTVLSAQPWKEDPTLLPFHWRDESTHFPEFPQRRMRIGIMKFDGVVMPHPPVLRAIDEVVTKLKERRDLFEVVEWKGTDHVKAWDLYSSLLFADGCAETLSAINITSEPLLPLTRYITKENPNCRKLSISDVWNMAKERDTFREDYAKLWNSLSVDVILCPATPGVAARHGTAKWWGYTSLWNLLDYPGLVFPVSVVDAEKDVKDTSYKPVGDRDKENFELYEPEIFHGAPVSLQLVGRRFDDEKIVEALSIMQENTGLPFVDMLKEKP